MSKIYFIVKAMKEMVLVYEHLKCMGLMLELLDFLKPIVYYQAKQIAYSLDPCLLNPVYFIKIWGIVFEQCGTKCKKMLILLNSRSSWQRALHFSQEKTSNLGQLQYVSWG